METVRTRIAPSPTGPLHVGTARTALFNELFAHQHGGQFIVRIEDTDRERSKPEFETGIIEGLRWLGLTWDEGPDVGGAYGPYRQSERSAGYTAALERLLAEGRAYYVDDGEAIKLKVDPESVSFTDSIRGLVTIAPQSWGGDFVIARSLTHPVFHLAVVVDDAAQKITHVIRGEDHVTNTARHILLQRALGLPEPHYAHLPLLLDEQRRKLSKRVHDVNLLHYRDRGILPSALLNYLVLLGWNPKNDREQFTHDELLQSFNLTSVQPSGAIFADHKLLAINKLYLRQLSTSALLEQAQPFLHSQGVEVGDTAYWERALKTEQPRVGTLTQLAEAVSFFRPTWPGDYRADLLIWKKSTGTATKKLLGKTQAYLATLPDSSYTEDTLTMELLRWIDQEHLDRGSVLWPVRVALTGAEHSPGPFEVAAVLGKRASLQRIEQALAKLG